MIFTGERYVPTEQGRIRLEHYHRYAVVLEAVKGKVVLDVACGEGYGSSLLADVAGFVYGVDISKEAISHASLTYRRSNLKFIHGSVLKLDFADDSFDAIVSYETIEHLAEQEKMLSEIRRVLRPDGILIISSPNRPVYSEDSGEHNEFHVKELDHKEFDTLLHSQFPEVRYYGQRLQISSVIQPLDTTPSESSVWSDNGEDLLPKAGRLNDPTYFLAICGAAGIPLPQIQMSALYPENLDLVRHYVGFAKWAQELDSNVSDLRKVLADRNKQIDAIHNSISWKISRPIRGCAHIIKNIQSKLPQVLPFRKQSTKHVFSAALNYVKQYHHLLPISYQKKRHLYRLLCMHFPWIFGLPAGKPASIQILRKSWARGTVVNSANKDEDSIGITSDPYIRTSNNPKVSVVIPIYGKLKYTLRCLHSVSATLPQFPIEVIVVDDNSPDESYEVLSKIKGIRLLRNDRNLGFIHSCNLGAKVAYGEYVCFLNNDTEVTSGWLDALLQTFEDFPKTGLVGSKLIYPNGSLQEAGGIIWQDGSAWNFGRLQNSDAPIYNYAREVDYCSGASILLPKHLFDELNGFDSRYAPAYCEDSDIALKVRSRGYRVIYQPMSVVIHFEGVSSGTDTSQGVKSYQISNTRQLYDRWKETLAAHQAPGLDVYNAKDRRKKHRVLVLDHCTPTPDQDAGSITVFNLLLLLREMDFQVTFIPEDNFLYMPIYTTALQRVGIEVIYSPFCTSVSQHLKQLGDNYDLVLVFRPEVANRHLSQIRKFCKKAKVLYHTADLHFLRMTREAKLLQDSNKLKDAMLMREHELGIIRRCDGSIVHSTAELELLRSELPNASLHVFPLILDTPGTKVGYKERCDLIFIGSYRHTPNVDAVKYMVTEIMPILRKQLSGVRFCIVGSNPPKEILQLASDDVVVMGYVEDLNAILETMRISVVPLRYGAGIKGKVGSALAVGVPVVSTSIGIEGMCLEHGANVLAADEPSSFADAVIKLYQDESLWNSLSKSGLEFSKVTWGAEAAWVTLARILADLEIHVERARYPLSLFSRIPYNSMLQNSLLPIGTVVDMLSYSHLVQDEAFRHADQVAQLLLSQTTHQSFIQQGFCIPCDKASSFLVDMKSGALLHKDGWTPNWRELLECPNCRMNNRQRLIATLVQQNLAHKQAKQIYFMEQVTPIFDWAQATLKQHKIFGSEYLGHQFRGGSIIKGIRHEDVENLSFHDAQLDMIVSNDVFEHVPNPIKAFQECARVLKAGAVMLATIPFHSESDISTARAGLNNGQVKHILPATFHGNPVSSDGSLVFTDFGWDVLDMLKGAGFSSAVMEIYSSPEFGHLGGPQLVIRGTK
jgi:O-antigen biosynthesis protein